MALIERQTTDKIEVVGQYKNVQVRTANIIERDGEEVSRTFHRHIVAPGDDYSNEDKTVQDICKAVHTSAVIDAYKAMLAEQV